MRNKFTRWNDRGGGLFLPEEIGFLSNLKDRVKAREGVLCVYEFPADDDGSAIRERGRCLVEPGFNLIVDTGRESLRLLQSHTADGGTAAGSYDLGYLAVGDGSNSGATVPTPSDTGLINELTSIAGVVPRPLLNVAAPPPGPPFTVNLWSAQIGTGQLNGETINEAGMFCLNQTTLFNFRTFANQAKSAGFILEMRFSILF